NTFHVELSGRFVAVDLRVRRDGLDRHVGRLHVASTCLPQKRALDLLQSLARLGPQLFLRPGAATLDRRPPMRLHLRVADADCFAHLAVRPASRLQREHAVLALLNRYRRCYAVLAFRPAFAFAHLATFAAATGARRLVGPPRVSRVPYTYDPRPA